MLAFTIAIAAAISSNSESLVVLTGIAGAGLGCGKYFKKVGELRTFEVKFITKIIMTKNVNTTAIPIHIMTTESKSIVLLPYF
jgi:hypothetical protein